MNSKQRRIKRRENNIKSTTNGLVSKVSIGKVVLDEIYKKIKNDTKFSISEVTISKVALDKFYKGE